MEVMSMAQIRLVEFSRFPFGRTAEHGPDNGERFRREVLVPAFRDDGTVEVILDGARGLSPSFLEEAFGGLVREGVPVETVLSRLRIRSEQDPSYADLVLMFVRDAGEQVH